jgi:hypothetical protein
VFLVKRLENAFIESIGFILVFGEVREAMGIVHRNRGYFVDVSDVFKKFARFLKGQNVMLADDIIDRAGFVHIKIGDDLIASVENLEIIEVVVFEDELEVLVVLITQRTKIVEPYFDFHQIIPSLVLLQDLYLLLF